MIDVPPRLALRPLDKRGLVVPYITQQLANGDYDFTTNNIQRRVEVLVRQQCALCGDKLTYWMYFIGGEKSHSSRVFTDPAMHEECARYATQVCPFLLNKLATYREQTKSMGDPTLDIRVDKSQLVRPKRMGLFCTRGYAVIKDRTGQILARAEAWKSVEWF